MGSLGLAGGLAYLVGRGITFRPGAPGVVRSGPVASGNSAVPNRVVFGLIGAGEVRAYPQLVLVWHEIVNDCFRDGPPSITHCPLTGSVLGLRGIAPGGKPYSFASSGDLVNSNLLMYDHQTASLWPQLLGQAILGPSRGQVLEQVPLDWATWGRWRAAHPDTAVLSTRTGFLRPYGRDPYGSYNYGPEHELFGYYRPGLGRYLYLPLMHERDRFDHRRSWSGPRSAPTAWRCASRCCGSGRRCALGWGAGRSCSSTTRPWTRDEPTWP